MAASPASTDRIWFLRRYGSSSVSGPAGVWRGGGTSARGQGRKVGKGAGPWSSAHSLYPFLTSIPGKVEVKDVGTVDTEVVQPPKVGLQLPAGQLCLQQQGQMAKDKCIQGGRAAETEKGRIEWTATQRVNRSNRKSPLWWGRLWAVRGHQVKGRTPSSEFPKGSFPQVAPAWT